MASVSKGRNASKEGSIGKKRRSGLSESDDNASKGNGSIGKKRRSGLSESDDNASKGNGSIGKKRRSGLSESDDNASKGYALSGKKNCEFQFSKIYNSSMKSHVPAELFRKDLISAMKLADSEQLSADDYWLISDTWKPEWEKGVQVPVNPDGFLETNIRILRERKRPNAFKKNFQQPKKLIKFSKDKNYSPDIHVLTKAPARHLKVCFYDLDIVDIEWLKVVNEELKLIGLPCITESTMELAMEKIENQCFYKLQEAIKTEAGLGIEYDDDVICDVCRSPDSEEGNEMVFCDACNVCVHQACYGITKIPEGSWVCRSCALGIRPSCILCPNVGGAMKSTRSGQKWTHVSCALWIPEVAIENVDKMEPITKISEIPASRWALVCSLCREKVGACIQCSVKTCKTAYHVTCAFQHGLAMKAIIDDDEDEDDVDLKSYCSKHTKEKKGLPSEELNDNSDTKNNKKELEMSNEEKASARLARVKQMEAEFYRYVSIREVARGLKLDITVVDFIYQYWILKRKANFDKPLVIPKSKPPELVENKPVNSLYARMKMFVHLRQDLERVRNLCYMVTKRERLSRSWCRIKRDIFLKQAEVINNDSLNYKETEKQAILNANHGDTVYDIMSSCRTSSNPSLNSILSALGEKTFPRKEHGALPKHNKSSSSSPLQRLPNPYAKQYLNNVLKRSQRSSTESCTEQDAKWKAMSENQKASRQKSKDIANKLAALQEAYKLKPMEIVVDKLPEDHDTCLQFSKFCKRTNISPRKRNSRSCGSTEKLHSEPLKKRAKIILTSRNKATKHHSKTETKENISSETNTIPLSQNSVHNSYDHSREEHEEDEKDLTSYKEGKEFSNDRKKEIQLNTEKLHSESLKKKAEIILNSRTKAAKHCSKTETKENISSETNTILLSQNFVHNSYDYNREDVGEAVKDLTNYKEEKEPSNDRKEEIQLHKHKEEDSLLYGKTENNIPNIQMKEVNEINNHQCEQSNHIEDKEQQEGGNNKFVKEININNNHEEKVNNHSNDFGSHEKVHEMMYSKIESSSPKQEEQGHTDYKETEVITVFDHRKNVINTCEKNDKVCSVKKDENGVTTHEKEVDNKGQASSQKKEENDHINPNKSENKKCHSKVDIINHKEDVIVYIDHIMEESKINNCKMEENKVFNDKEENEKHPETDIINGKQEEHIGSIMNADQTDHHNKIERKLDNHDKDENEINYHEKNDLCSHKKENEVDSNWKEETGFNNHKKWENEFNNRQKIENQQYKRKHELLKDVKVSVQRYTGGSVQRYTGENIMKERRNLNTKASNKEISVNSCAKLENSSLLHEKYETLELQVKSTVEDAHFQDSPKSLPNDCTQAAISRKPGVNEVQTVKNSSLGQMNKKSGSLLNSEKVLSYEQRLMNSKRLRKEDIIIPAKPFIENSKPQKSNERNKIHADAHKLNRKEHFYKKHERLNKSSSVMKNTAKSLHQPNFKCNEGERTPCKKPEGNFNIMKHNNKHLVKDLSRHSGFEIELQKSNLKDKKSQIAHEKMTSETVTRENLNPVNSKDVYNKTSASRHNVSSNCTNSEMFNKRLSPKSNMHKYTNVPDKLHYSPTCSNHAQSSLTVFPNKDSISDKEKLRQESAKIRQSLFAVSTCTAKSLSGYKIPKKSRTDSVEKNSAQSSQDTCKLSPLYGVCQIPQTETYPHNGYHTDRNFRGCKYGPRIRNGEQHSQEQKLLMKLSKDPNYSNAARWQSDPASSGRDSFCVIQNNSAFPPLGRNAHCDRSCAPADSGLLSASTDTGGYWVCEDSTGNFIKHFSHNIQNGDYGLS